MPSSPPTDFVDDLIDDWSVERPDMDVSGMAVVGRLIRLGQRLEVRADAVLKEHDLHYSDFDVLATLRRKGEPYELMPKRLMTSVLLTSGAMTALLDRLERRGLITRGSAASDGRVRTARLTVTGKQLTDRAAAARFVEAAATRDLLSQEDAAELARILRRLSLGLDTRTTEEIDS